MIPVFLGNLEAVFTWLLSASWQASVLALLVLALQWALRGRLNPRWRYALWLLVLIRLVLPVEPESALSLFQFAPPPPAAIVAPVTEPLFVEAAPAVTLPEVSEPEPSRPVSIYSLLAMAWLTGALILLLLTWQVNRRFGRQVASSPEISDPELLKLFIEAKTELGIRRTIRLIENGQVQSPAIMGLFQPTLLLPADVREKFDATELRLIFLHELAHLKRGDVIAQGLIALLQILHWFNPVLWFAFRRMRIDREPATDALVLSRTGEAEKERYGLMLIKLLEHFNQRHSLPTLVGILEDKDQFKRRFSLIAKFTRGAYGWSLLGVVLIGLLAVACLTKGRAHASDTTNEISTSENTAAPSPQASLVMGGNPIALSRSAQEKIAQQVEEIIRSSEIVPEGIIVRLTEVNYDQNQIKTTGSYLHISYPKGKDLVSGENAHLIKEVFLGLADIPKNNFQSGGSYPGYPGSICLVSEGGGFPLGYSARSSEKNGELLMSLGRNPDLYPHLTAAMRATVDLVTAAQKGDTATLKKLIAEGVDLKTIKGPEGSLLCYAGSPEVAEILLQHGIPVNATDNQHQTALIHICGDEKRDRASIAPIVSVLLKHGADPNSAMMGDSDVTAVKLALDGPTVDALVAAGATIPPLCAWNAADLGMSFRSLDYYQALVRHGLDLKRGPWTGSQGLYLLLRAIEVGGKEDVIEWLLNQGIDPNSVYYRGKYPKGLPETPLEHAIKFKNDKAIAVLLAHGAKVDKSMLSVRTYLAPPHFFSASTLKDTDVLQELAAKGILFPPGTSATFLRDSGKLVVRNTPEQLDLIAHLVDQAAGKGAETKTTDATNNQIKIELKVVEIDDDVYQANKEKIDAGVDKGDPALFSFLNNLEGVDIFSTPSVTTQPGLKANVEIVREFPYPTRFEYAHLAKAEYADGSTGATIKVPTTPREFATKDVGVIAEITPSLGEENSPDRGKIVLNGKFTMTSFEGFIKSNLITGAGMPSFSTSESLFLEALDDKQLKAIWIPGEHVSVENPTAKNIVPNWEQTFPKVKKRYLVFVSANLVK